MSVDVVKQKAISDVESCIGCNDCMVACPIDEKAYISIALLNEAVLQTNVERIDVQRFVDACTQCQRCVPVCPADISRANMVLYNKQKRETTNEDRPILMMMRSGSSEQKIPTGWTVEAITQFLKQRPEMKHINRTSLRILAWNSSILALDEQETLFHADDFHEFLYIIVDGQVAEHAAGMDLLYLQEGGILGLEAVLTDEPEAHRVYAIERTEVLRIHKTTVERVRKSDPQFNEFLEGLYKKRVHHSIFEAPNPFAILSPEHKQQLLERATVRRFQEGDVILSPSDRFDGLYLIRAGFVQFKAKERVLDYYGPSDAFGELSALTIPIHPQGTLRAASKAYVLFVHRDSLRIILRSYPHITSELEQQFIALTMASQPQPKSAEQPPKKSNTTALGLSLDSVGSKGLLGAETVLVIDQQICTDCNACVDACASRHGAPRLRRTGLQLSRYLFPSACRHCDDPKCLMCTVRGIRRLPSGEISIDPEGSCVGCGACAARCPYDNIQMVLRDTLSQKKKTGIFQSLKNLFLPEPAPGGERNFWETGSLLDLMRGRGISYHPPEPPKGKEALAIKCDLCTGFENQACVHACPVGAAFRVTGTDIMEASMANLTKGHDDV